MQHLLSCPCNIQIWINRIPGTCFLSSELRSRKKILPRTAEILHSYHGTGQFLKSHEEQNMEFETDSYPVLTSNHHMLLLY